MANPSLAPSAVSASPANTVSAVKNAAAGSAPTSPRPRTWDACAGLYESQARLARLDPEIVFDESFPEPIRYDPQRGVLRYRGFMSHASYLRLRGLSEDRAYQTAMEQLFVATSSPLAEPRTLGAWWKPAAALALLLTAVLAALWWSRSPAPPPAPAVPLATAPAENSPNPRLAAAASDQAEGEPPPSDHP